MDEAKIKSLLYLRCALPLAKVLREEAPQLYDVLHYKFNAVVQFAIKEEPELGAQLVFKDGKLDVVFGVNPDATVTLEFPTKDAFNGFMAGKMGGAYLPRIKRAHRIDAVARVLPMLLGLKILDPMNIPTDPGKKAMKVKLLLYFVTSALSQLNRCEDEEMKDWTGPQPERIYQWSVLKGGPAAFLRVKAGRTKSGRGVYERRRPFVHMIFPDVEGAFAVLTNQAPLVEAVQKGFVVTEGAMEYSKDVGHFMQKIEGLLK